MVVVSASETVLILIQLNPMLRMVKTLQMLLHGPIQIIASKNQVLILRSKKETISNRLGCWSGSGKFWRKAMGSLFLCKNVRKILNGSGIESVSLCVRWAGRIWAGSV